MSEDNKECGCNYFAKQYEEEQKLFDVIDECIERRFGLSYLYNIFGGSKVSFETKKFKVHVELLDPKACNVDYLKGENKYNLALWK